MDGLQVSAPAMIPRSAYKSLTPERRGAFNVARAQHHMGGLSVHTTAVADIERLLLPSRDRGGRVVVVDGPPRSGKSWSVMRSAARFETCVRTHSAAPASERSVPVVYASVGTAKSSPDAAGAVAQFLGMSVTPRGSRGGLVGNVCDELVRAGTRVVVLDDAHMLSGCGNEAAELVHKIAGVADVCVVVIGLGLPDGAFHFDSGFTQTQLRTWRTSMTGCEGTAGDEWRGIVAQLESQLRLYEHVPGTLTAGCCGLLHRWTGGSIADLVGLVGAAAVDVVGSGSEAITTDVLERLCSS
ncbi:ATP-binding protein [Nocardia tengchongensis]|uniref:ATP-binding protein n=1 Tax=Nocardia tengchongensis TaxID=2055889 RepID=UPI003405EE85